MMIDENRHLALLANNATLNEHRKATSEESTRELLILANHRLVDHHHPLPLLTARELVRLRPPAPLSAALHFSGTAFQRHCKPSNE